MNRQDLSGVRTAQDLERKYNFEEIKRNVEKVKKNSEDINSINKDLQDFAKNITKDLGELQDQVDGNITTWFYKGVPTLSNYPANEWTTTEDRNNHLGDLYYDQDTGYSYRFTMLKSVFQWVKLTDSDITEALAVANAAQDTADKKRRVFLEQPKPPYDSGDMWIKDKEIWICQVSRAEGTYQTGDFINNLKYTDDTYAKGVNDDLIIVKGTVTKTRQDVDSLQTTMTSTVEALNTQGEKIGTLETKQSNITQTVEGIDARVTRNTNSINNINTPIKDLSGSTIHLEDGANAPLVKLEVDGKTEQETREGYNLLPQPYNVLTTSKTIGGVQITLNNDYSISFNGKATSEEWFTITKIPEGIFTENVGEGESSNGYCLAMKKTILNMRVSASSRILTTKFVVGRDYTGITIYPMITTEANKNKPYQPYGISPSPDYPSKIENVGYENLFDSEFAKDYNNATHGIYNFIKLSGLKAGKTYTFSNIDTTQFDTTRNYIRLFKEEAYSGEHIEWVANKTSMMVSTKTFTIPSSWNNVYLGVYPANEINYNEVISKFENAMLNEGTKPISYIPYGKYGLDITNVGKNFLNENTLIKNKVPSISNGNIVNFAGGGYYNQFVKVNKQKGNYISALGNCKKHLIFYDNNKNFISYVEFSNSYSLNPDFIVKNNIFYLLIRTDNFSVTKNVLVSAGLVAIPYEPYQGYNTQIILPTQLAEQDKLIKQNGTWGIYKTTNKIILNGSENVLAISPNSKWVQYKIADIGAEALKKTTPTSNYYVGYPSETSKVNTIVIYTENYNRFLIKDENIGNSITNKEQWIALIKERHNSGNPVIVQYELETPTFTPLDQQEQDKLDKISTFKGINNISTTDELEPNMNITYVRDTNISNYVSEQLGELSVSNNQIKASVKEIGTNLDTNTQQLNQVQNTITSQNQTIEIISKNIDKTNGNIKEVTTTNGFTFNNKGLNIYTDENSYNTQIDNVGTYYRDGNAVIAQTTKDGSLMKDLSEQGQHRYSYDTTDSTYNLIDETIEIDGEIGYATFWNGED